MFRTIGPGAILLGTAIGGGEWLMGPIAVTKYGLSILSIAVIAIFLQAQLNLELVRYTIYTGEPIITGFMRTSPGPRFWGGMYAVLAWFQNGLASWVGTAAGALAAGVLGRLPDDQQDGGLVLLLSSLLLLLCGALLISGRKIERTLERLSWFIVSWVLLYMGIAVALFVPFSLWADMFSGIVSFRFIAEARSGPGLDWFLVAAFAASSGAGGITNVGLSNWYRDKGFGMGKVVGYIPSLFSGRDVKLAETGKVFPTTAENRNRWKQWVWFAKVDQYGVFLFGALVGMVLPCLLAVQVLPAGKDLRGLAVAAEVASGLTAVGGSSFWFLTLFCGFWILFSTQLGCLDALVRIITDILWSGSSRVRKWRGGDVRWLYYTLLGMMMIWGLTALHLATPIFLFQITANIGGVITAMVSVHVLYVNRVLLPPAVRPPLWRQITLVLCAAFYGTFVFLSVQQMVG